MFDKNFNRREFMNVFGITALTAGTLLIPGDSNANTYFPKTNNINHIGPIEGYTPQIGTLLSMLEWISNSVIIATTGLSIEQLDYIHDKDSNSIGALMMHVAATEVIYQDITFHNLNEFSNENKAKWNVAMNLGEEAQNKIKGNNLNFYIDAMQEARAKTKKEMKIRNDEWLLTGETKKWNWNNYCKWFHVTEHFANHRGQITWYKKRLPI